MEASTTSTTAVEEHEARVSTANATDQAQQDAFFRSLTQLGPLLFQLLACRGR